MPSWRAGENATLRPVNKDVAAPTVASASPDSARLAMMAAVPRGRKNGGTGKSAPTPKRRKDAPAGGPAAKARQSGEEDGAFGRCRAGNPHDEAQIGNQTVIGAEHSGAQRVSGGGTMAALQARQRGPGEAAVACGGRMDDARVGALVG